MIRSRKLLGASGALVLVGMMALTACGGSSAAAAKPTATPNAAAILADAKQVQYKDISFKMTIDTTTAGASVSGDGSGVITLSPKRAQITFNLTASGQQLAFDTIEDSDTNTVYVKFSSAFIPGLPTDKWIKSSANGSLSSLTSTFDTSQLTGFDQLSGATLKGSESVDGVQVWHLTGSQTSSGATANEDVYIRQDNNQPYKIVVHAAGSTAADATITFTGINTGATVTLPSPDQVMDMPS